MAETGRTQAARAKAWVSIPSFAQFQAPIRSKPWAHSPHFVLHLCARPEAVACDAAWRIGAMLPKRHAKKAVRRNLLRRLIYAQAVQSFAAWPAQAQAMDCVVRLRAPWPAAHYPSASSPPLRRAVREELQSLFAHALKKAQQPSPSAAPDHA